MQLATGSCPMCGTSFTDEPGHFYLYSENHWPVIHCFDCAGCGASWAQSLAPDVIEDSDEPED